MSMWESMKKELEGQEACIYVAPDTEISLESGHKAFEVYIKGTNGEWTRRMRGSATPDRIPSMIEELGIPLVVEDPIASD